MPGGRPSPGGFGFTQDESARPKVATENSIGGLIVRVPESPLLVTHIPKTAGTSLKSLLTAHCQEVLLIYGGELSLQSPNIEFARDFRSIKLPTVVMGHFSYGVHRLLGVPPRYAAVFRDPIERVVSLYRHQRRSTHTQQIDPHVSLADFVSSSRTEMTNNHMCRMVAGIPPESGMVIKSQWLLELAIHNLERHYEIIGTLDHLDQALPQFSRLLGVDLAKFPCENTSSNCRPEVDRSTLEVLQDFNELDIQLYEYVSNKCSMAYMSENTRSRM
jgi:hypothetical protein